MFFSSDKELKESQCVSVCLSDTNKCIAESAKTCQVSAAFLKFLFLAADFYTSIIIECNSVNNAAALCYSAEF